MVQVNLGEDQLDAGIKGLSKNKPGKTLYVETYGASQFGGRPTLIIKHFEVIDLILGRPNFNGHGLLYKTNMIICVYLSDPPHVFILTLIQCISFYSLLYHNT